MELRLVNSHENEKLAYYKNGDIQVNGDDFVLLGFKNLKAVLDIPDKMKPENNLTSITKKTVPKMQLDAAGEKFIHLNGRKLKVVSQNQIPEEICKRTILLKNKMVNLGNTKNPVKLCVISSATQLAGNKADMKDKPVSNILIDKLQCTTPKKLRLISIKNIIKPVHCDPPSQSENSNGIIDSVNPKNILSDSQGLPEQIDSFLISNTSAKGTTKLLTSKNIDILNKVKMQALNLSKKTKVVDSAVQTDPQSVMDQNIQTDPSHDSLDSLQVLCNWIEFVLTESMSYKVKTMPDSADRTLKKQRFFKDLNECLKPSLNGNLPIHEGVIDNNISLVKRMCMALKARGVGINEENNNGCVST
ncbi:hypothetical protein GWI33_013401 [Rhynchophorus ferrugineus]|uniref:Uncharacterized protein n=1 Tax=Rhynchophorus ferrugineus TaxID=354439 RepID=A0A834IH28_RHYFE|nr:hypothetical protein GWI33_013401 [Rhynchophorus ferrugineus]